MNLKALVILKVHFRDNENPIENVHSVEVLIQILLRNQSNQMLQKKET